LLRTLCFVFPSCRGAIYRTLVSPHRAPSSLRASAKQSRESKTAQHTGLHPASYLAVRNDGKRGGDCRILLRASQSSQDGQIKADIIPKRTMRYFPGVGQVHYSTTRYFPGVEQVHYSTTRYFPGVGQVHYGTMRYFLGVGQVHFGTMRYFPEVEQVHFSTTRYFPEVGQVPACTIRYNIVSLQA